MSPTARTLKRKPLRNLNVDIDADLRDKLDFIKATEGYPLRVMIERAIRKWLSIGRAA